jgi:hypothetical protein
MTRPWGKQYAHMLNHPKYLRASVEERSAWHSLFLVALNSPREDVFGTRDEVIALLSNIGHGAAAADRLDGLIRLHFVDVRRGQHRLHDWSDWQPADPTGAKRKAEERARQNGKRPRTVPGQSGDGHETNGGASPDGHALDGDGEKEKENPHPRPRPKGRGDRKRSSSGTTDWDALMGHDDDEHLPFPTGGAQ